MNVDAEKILSVIDKQRFYDFYMGDFESYIGGYDNAPTKEEILKEIASLFKDVI